MIEHKLPFTLNAVECLLNGIADAYTNMVKGQLEDVNEYAATEQSDWLRPSLPTIQEAACCSLTTQC